MTLYVGDIVMLNRSICVATLILGLFAPAAQAQVEGPAEQPPATFTGNQYVDSRGCVFIRAGVGGEVSWVARVTRTRAPVCGYKPTIATDVAAAPAPVAEPVAEPVAPPPATRPVARPEDGPRDTTVVAAAEAPRPQARASAAPANVRAKAPVRRKAQRSRTRTVARPVVVAPRRVGPPAGTLLRRTEIPQGVRVMPKHVYENSRTSRVMAPTPKGYRPAFSDDRLNPRRAEMNRSGIEGTRSIWTNTVPRRLKTGRD